MAQSASLVDSFNTQLNKFTTPPPLHKLDQLTDESLLVNIKAIGQLKNKRSKFSFQGTMFNEFEYIQNSFLPKEANGSYNRLGFSGRINLGRLPFNAGFTLNIRNKSVWADYTLMNFSFDSKQLSQDLKEQYLDKLADLSQFYPKELAQQITQYKDSMAKFDQAKALLSSGKYYEHLRTLNQQLKPLQDSILQFPNDSLLSARYHQAKDSIDRYKSVAQEFTDLEKYRVNNKMLGEYLDKHTQYVDSVKRMTDILTNPDIKSQLMKSGLLSRKEAIFAGIKKLGIGRVNLELSEFTGNNLPIYGFNLDYLFKQMIYVGAGLGIASPNNFQFNPSLNNIQRPLNFNFNRFMGYFRIGLGSPEQDFLHLIYLSYGERFDTANQNAVNPRIAPANAVLSLVGKKVFKNGININGELATANASYTQREATFLPIAIQNKKVNFNYAAKFSIAGEIKKSATALSAKGIVISDLFTTSGNPFMRRNMLEYSAGIQQPLISNKLNLSSSFTHNINGLMSDLVKQSFVNLSNSISFSPSGSANYIVSHTLLRQVGQFSSSNHIVSFLQNYSYGKKNIKGITAITTNVTLAKSGTTETKFENNNYQLSLQQTLLLPKNVRLTIGGGSILLTINNALQKPVYWAEAGGSLAIKKALQLNSNFRFMNDQSNAKNYFLTVGLSGIIYKGLQYKVSEQLQVISKLANTLNSQTVVGLSYSFSGQVKGKG